MLIDMSIPKGLLLLFIVIGLVDSIYLTAVHYSALPLYCPNSGRIDCAAVVQSSLSEVAGIPVSIGGIVWFAVFGVLLLALPRFNVVRNLWYIFALGAVAYSLAGQEILGKLCVYCDLLDAMLLLCVIIGLKYVTVIFSASVKNSVQEQKPM